MFKNGEEEYASQKERTRCWDLDHAGNNHALGLFTDIFHDHLDNRMPRDRGEAYKDDYKPAKPRKCSKCHNLVPPGARACPTCNERLPLHHGVVVLKDGRMVLVGSGPQMTKEHQRWYSELLGVARSKRYKDGWAAVRFQEKFGIRPSKLKVRGKTEVSDDVRFVCQGAARQVPRLKRSQL